MREKKNHYEIDGETKPTFPDFIIIRKDDILGYVIDILEPHNSEFKDNLGKARGFVLNMLVRIRELEEYI